MINYILSKRRYAYVHRRPAVSGYQVCNAFIAINKGGLFGAGIGKSTQKYSYIPEPHTDMVFAITAEENGLVGATAIFILYLVIRA